MTKEKMNFTKMVASGNDFIVIDRKLPGNPKYLAPRLCDRRFGIGADGLLLLGGAARGADLTMRIINADGSEAQMCGNGARCAALYSGRKNPKISTLAGLIEARVSGKNVKIRLTDPRGMREDVPVRVCGRLIRVNCIDTGVPHAVIFVKGLENIDVDGIGRMVRYYSRFAPAGTNVDFAEETGCGSISVRTYERGVEGETLACGTGSTASALVFAAKKGLNNTVKVKTLSGEVLTVYFQKAKDKFTDVWLEGSARKVYRGVWQEG